MKKHITFLLFLCFPLYLKGITLPQSPDGYEWEKYEEAKSAFLKPDNWHVKKEAKGNTRGLFISKENIEDEGSFQTGLSANIISNFSSSNVSPSNYAANYILQIEKTKDVVMEPFLIKMVDGILGMGIRYRDDSKKPSILVHYFIIADDKADILRITFFESPEITWDKEWIHGEKMLNGQLWR